MYWETEFGPQMVVLNLAPVSKQLLPYRKKSHNIDFYFKVYWTKSVERNDSETVQVF